MSIQQRAKRKKEPKKEKAPRAAECFYRLGWLECLSSPPHLAHAGAHARMRRREHRKPSRVGNVGVVGNVGAVVDDVAVMAVGAERVVVDDLAVVAVGVGRTEVKKKEEDE